MKIGLSSWAFRWAAGTRDFRPPSPLTHLGLLQKAHALGVQVVQICDNMPLDALDDDSLLHLRDEARRLGLTLEAGTASARREHLERFIHIAHLLDAHLLRVVEDMKEWQPTPEDIAAELRRVLPACRQHRVTIAVENHFSLGSRDVARIVQTVNDPLVGICLDTINSVARLEGWRESLAVLAPYAVSLHVKDAAVERRGVGFTICGRPLGKGLVDVATVLQTVQAHGRRPNVLLELWMDFSSDGATTLRQEEQWIGDSLTYLRRFIA